MGRKWSHLLAPNLLLINISQERQTSLTLELLPLQTAPAQRRAALTSHTYTCPPNNSYEIFQVTSA